jgi:methyl-accepting chemotaxis protein
MMRWIRDLPVRAKLGLVVVAMALALAAEIALSLSTIERLRVGGPTYRRIEEYRDAIERLSTLESDLNAYQAALLALAQEHERDLVAQGDARRREIGARVDAGFEEAAKLALAEEIRVGLASARSTWQEFRDVSEKQVVPAISHGDGSAVHGLITGVQARRYRRFIEQVGTAVNQSRLEVDVLEAAAATEARRRVQLMGLGVAAVLAGALAVAFVLTRSFTGPLATLTRRANRVAGGTIPAGSLRLESRDELGRLAEVFDDMLAAIRDIVAAAQQAARRLDASAKELLDANRRVSDGASEQATQLRAVSEVTNRMATALHELSQTAETVSRTASQNAEAAEDGARAVEESTRGLEAIRLAGDEVKSALLAATQASQRIGTIVEALQDIATETHVLSLNASIEAARAGEAGRGFAVVAGEVRSLAERAAQSSREIDQIVAGIFEHMRAAQAAVDRNVAAVKRGTESGRILAGSFEAIHGSARATRASVEEMTSVLKDQVGATQQTATVVDEVSQVASESMVASRQLLDLGHRLTGVVHDLEHLLARFSVEDDRSAPASPSSPAAPELPERPATSGEAAPAASR